VAHLRDHFLNFFSISKRNHPDFEIDFTILLLIECCFSGVPISEAVRKIQKVWATNSLAPALRIELPSPSETSSFHERELEFIVHAISNWSRHLDPKIIETLSWVRIAYNENNPNLGLAAIKQQLFNRRAQLSSGSKSRRSDELKDFLNKMSIALTLRQSISKSFFIAFDLSPPVTNILILEALDRMKANRNSLENLTVSEIVSIRS
jgi:hypothetical protein